MQKIAVEYFIFACWIHLLQFLKDCLWAITAYVLFRHEKITLEVVLGDHCIVVDRNIYSCEDEVFG